LEAPACATRCPPCLWRRERHPAGKGGTEGEKLPMNLAIKWRLPHNLKGSLTCRFTSPPKEGMLRNFSPWKIWRLRLGSNLRTRVTPRPPKLHIFVYISVY
jgi:hypothetical protein